MSSTVVVIASEPPAPGTPTIFVLTCLFIQKATFIEEGGLPDPPPPTPRVEIKRTRTWGWYPTLARATQAAMNNETDMFEMGYYNAVVVEEFPCGTMEMAIAEHWFEVGYTRAEPESYNPAGYDVVPIAKPPGLEHLVGFAW